MIYLIQYPPSALVLSLAALVTATGGVIATVWAPRRARDEELRKCEERLRAVHVEAGTLAEELYSIKARKETS